MPRRATKKRTAPKRMLGAPEGTHVPISRDMIWAMSGYHVHSEEVLRMHRSQARLKIISAPARTSKSWSGTYDLLPDCFHDMWMSTDGTKTWPCPGEKRIWIVAPTYQLAKEFDYLAEVLVDKRKKFGFTFYRVEKYQKNADQGQMKLVLNFGNSYDGTPVRTHIEVKSATNMTSIQADQADVVLMSEAADQDEIVWSKYISTRYGRAILPTTPKIRAEWLRKLIVEGQENRERSKTETFYYDGRCNPTYDWSRYWAEHYRAESRQSCPMDKRINPQDEDQPPSDENGHDCFGKPDTCWAFNDPHFAEQYMGRWSQAEGRMLPFRTESVGSSVRSHVLTDLPSWAEWGRHFLSVDYGFDDPTAVCWYTVGEDGTVILYDMLYKSGLTPSDVARRVNARLADRGYYKERFGWQSAPEIHQVSGDPQKPEMRAELRRVGLPVVSVDKVRQRDRALGFNVFRDYLSDDPLTGRPKFYVLRSTCQQAIDEFRLIRRKENSADEYNTVGADHAVDATRYLLTILPRGAMNVPKRYQDPEIERQIWLNQRMLRSYNNGAATLATRAF